MKFQSMGIVTPKKRKSKTPVLKKAKRKKTVPVNEDVTNTSKCNGCARNKECVDCKVKDCRKCLSNVNGGIHCGACIEKELE